MENKHKRRLDLLSSIDDKILDRQTAQRIRLLAGFKKRRFTQRLWISVGSAAAALLLVLSSLLVIVPLLSKQVPIYTGMTVSGENTAHTLATAIHTVHYADPGNTNNNGNHYGWYDGDSTDQEDVSEDMIETPLENALSVTGGAKSLYTAKPGEDIYITVHLENPDSFEILSFTLGGQKYSSYMFEQGSDMENIIIKVNVGDAQGIVDYTIDAIKYVDGEKIKDVRMEGDRTVQVGVAAKTQPAATVAEQRISFDSIRLGLTNEDALGLVSLTGGKLIALLYDGSSVVQEKEISTQTAVSLTFDGLSPNRVYQYAIVAHYDAFDGNGMADHVLLKDTFRTASPVLFDEVTVGISTLSFSYHWDSAAQDGDISATLYANGKKVRNIGSDTTVSDLLPATTYTLVANYQLNGKTEQITLEFTTKQLIYTVRYLLSPLTGTDCVLESEYSVALQPGDVFAPEAKAIEGFTAPEAKQLTANTESENTVIEYRYERNRYNVSFHANGAQTQQALLFGASLADAVHPAHTFAYWQDVSGNRYTTVPARNVTLYAVFEGELTADDLQFSGSGEITVTGLKNTALTSLVIPAYVNGGKVVAIGDNAFKNATYLTSVTLPATLKRVGLNAFDGCVNLERVVFDGTLADWCNITFAENSETGYMTIDGHTAPDTACYTSNPVVYAKSLYLTAAPTTNVLEGTLTLPTGTLTGQNCFVGASITTLVIPEGATTMPAYLLVGLYELQTLRFNATSMADLTDREPYRLIGTGFMSDGVAIEIGASVTRIPANRPFGGMKIRSITFAEGSACSEIGAQAFSTGCCDGWSLGYYTELVLPAGLRSLGERAIYGKYLTTITLPASITHIGANTFLNCTSLANVRFLGSLSEWNAISIGAGNDPLTNAANLKIGCDTHLAYTDGACSVCGIACVHTYVNSTCTVCQKVCRDHRYVNAVCSDCGAVCTHNYADGTCSACGTVCAHNYVDSTCTICQKVCRDHRYANGVCSVCRKVCGHTYTDGICTVCSMPCQHAYTDGTCSVCDIRYIDPALRFTQVGQTYSVSGYSGSAREIVIPVTYRGLPVTAIGNNAFRNCTSLQSITLQNGLTHIGDHAFNGCASLTDLSLPDGLTSISGSAFYGCTGLTVDTLPDGLTTIGAYAFKNCTGITNLSIPASVTSIGNGALDGCPLVSVSLPGCTGANDLFASTVPEALARVTVVGTAIPARAFDENRWLDRMELIIAEGVTSIGDHAFYQRSMNSITFPSTLESIGEYAFYNCGAKTMTFLGGDIAMGKYAFSSCYRLKSVHINDVFAWATNSYADTSASPLSSEATPYLNGEPITEITISADVTRFGPYAFYGFTSLASVHITDMTAWLDLEFEGLYANPMYYADHLYLNGQEITELTIPNGITAIGDYAFLNHTSLQSVMVSEGVTHIGAYAFKGCTGLKNVSLPNTLEYVEYGAFDQTVNTYTDPETGATYLGNEQNKYLVLMYVGPIDPEVEFFVVPEQTKIVYSVDRDASVVLHDNIVCITNIENTLHGCSPFRSLPSSLKYLLCRELWCDQNLETFEIPDSVIQIGDGLISGTSIETLKIGKGIEVLDERFFYNVSIENLYLSNNLKEIKFTFSTEDPSDCSFTADEIYFDGTREEWLAIEGHEHFSIRSVTFLQA